MKVTDFDFPLPAELIAQNPAPRRDESRLMVVDRSRRRWEHRVVRQLPELVRAGDLLVWNNTRVFPARLFVRRPGKNERIEVLLVRETGAGEWIALLKPARKAPRGQELRFSGRRVDVIDLRSDGSRVLRFADPASLMEEIELVGEPPLPPYIRRDPDADLTEDRIRYQTVYARHTGSVAAPTAGLHFTPDLIRRLDEAGVQRVEVLLHVGYGTFQPVRCECVEDHRLEPEAFEISPEAAAAIREGRSAGRRILAVGSTTTRVLEHAGREGTLRAASGLCDLFIYPGFQFRVVDGLITNFHLPRSTLFMLVCAFAGRDLMLECYEAAVRKRYRFFSYGDCMLIL